MQRSSNQLTHQVTLAPKSATVEAEDELPEITESTVETFSAEVRNFRGGSLTFD